MNAPTLSQERIEKIRSAIETAIDCKALDIIDESHLHAGHEGAKTGLGHFRVMVRSPDFAAQSLIKRHRMIYDAVGDLMSSDIHALSIDANVPDE